MKLSIKSMPKRSVIAMGRHKIHPDMPSGLSGKERREWFKANGICCRCFKYIEINCTSRTFCESCLIQERTVQRERFRKRNQKLKRDNLEFCAEQVLGVSETK